MYVEIFMFAYSVDCHGGAERLRRHVTREQYVSNGNHASKTTTIIYHNESADCTFDLLFTDDCLTNSFCLYGCCCDTMLNANVAYRDQVSKARLRIQRLNANGQLELARD